ncbi:MAG: hypothetical protein ACFFDN_30675 [Candidatus Hodarchaeota archaeon]
MDGDSHLVGSIIFYGVYWLFTGFPKFGILLIGLLVSILGGTAPDMLEPPTWSGHRSIFHWIGILMIILALFFSPPRDPISIIISAFSIGYFSHFVLDYLI